MCGGLQILLGCCSVIFNAVVIPGQYVSDHDIYDIGFGIWSPVLVRYRIQ